MSSTDTNYVSDIVFQRSLSEQFSAELAIGPALALLATQTPSSGYRQTLVSIAAVVLAFSSILRFLVYTDRFANPDRVTHLTLRPLQLSAIICLAQIVRFIATKLSPAVPGVEIIGLGVLTTVLGTVIFILLYESTFQTYRFSWGVLYYVKAISLTHSIAVDLDDADALIDAISLGDSLREWIKITGAILIAQILRAVYVSMAYYLLRDSIPDEEGGDPHLSELRMWVDAYCEQVSVSGRTSITFAFVISSAVVLPVYFALSWTLSWVLGPLLTVFGLVVVMRLLMHIVNITYISFGGLRYDQILTTNARSIAIDGIYTLVVGIMLVPILPG